MKTDGVPKQMQASEASMIDFLLIGVHSGSKTPSDAAARGLRPGSSTTAKTGAFTGAVKQEADAKFKATQAKAKLSGVAALTQKDIEGLSREQIKQLRGY